MDFKNKRADDLSEEDAKIVAQQLRQPSGDLAVGIASAMKDSNQSLILQMYQSLDAQNGEHILEIGPGSGDELYRLFELGARVSVLDHSPEVLAILEKNYPQQAREQRLHIYHGSMGTLPFEAQTLDAVCSSNTLYFWNDYPLCFQELKRVLKPGGRLVLGIRSRQAVGHMAFAQHGFTLFSPAELVSLVESHGFELRHLERQWSGPVDCVTLYAVNV